MCDLFCLCGTCNWTNKKDLMCVIHINEHFTMNVRCTRTLSPHITSHVCDPFYISIVLFSNNAINHPVEYLQRMARWKTHTIDNDDNIVNVVAAANSTIIRIHACPAKLDFCWLTWVPCLIYLYRIQTKKHRFAFRVYFWNLLSSGQTAETCSIAWDMSRNRSDWASFPF